MNAAVKEDIGTPLIKAPGRRKKFVLSLWCIYAGIFCSWVLEELLAKNDLRLFSLDSLGVLGWLLYATFYFSRRANGNNFLFLIWGINKPYSKGWLLSSDIGAAAVYILFVGYLIFSFQQK